MPLSKHFGGHGDKVLSAMRATYGGKKSDEEIKRIFYATEAARRKHAVKKAMQKG